MYPHHRLLTTSIVALALAFAGVPAPVHSEELCSLPPITYAAAKQAHPDAAFALTKLETHGIATWYSDREENGDYVATAQQLVTSCPESSRLSVVVYGLPNKDCEAGYSTTGSRVRSAADYDQFITTLTNTIGKRKVLYVLEPDAIGLLAKTGGCAEASGYKRNLQTAIRLLSTNPNAEIYLDVGYWTLQYSEQAAKVATIVKELAAAGRVKGITLNTSNYRSNTELAALCSTFQRAMGSTTYRCVFDTSRNYNGAPASNEWCNTKTAGIGNVPTSNTGLSNVDYFIWIKPPGDSDGTCDDDKGAHSWEAMRGPAAGAFFADSFRLLWNQGVLVNEMGMPKIDGSVRTTAPTPTPTPTGNTGSLSSSSGSSAGSELDVGDNSASAAANSTVSVNANQSLSPVSTPPTASLILSPATSSPLTSLLPSSRPDTETQSASTTASASSTRISDGVVAVLVLAGVAAAAVGVAFFWRARRAALDPRKSLNAPLVPGAESH